MKGGNKQSGINDLVIINQFTFSSPSSILSSTSIESATSSALLIADSNNNANTAPNMVYGLLNNLNKLRGSLNARGQHSISGLGLEEGSRERHGWCYWYRWLNLAVCGNFRIFFSSIITLHFLKLKAYEENN